MTLKQQIHEWMTGREDEFVTALAPLIAVDSTTGKAEPGKPYGPGPAAALEAALELARSWGMTTENVDGYVGTADLNDKPDQLHILAHLDIVGVGDGWDTDPFTIVRDGDLIYGRGTDDDKGPAVAALLAMRCIRELGLPLTKNVKLIFGTDEESGSGDLAYYYAKRPFAPNSVTPDTAFPVTNIEKARYGAQFSHSWEPMKSRVKSVKGGVRINVVPGTCTAVLEDIPMEVLQEAMTRLTRCTGVAFRAAEENGLLTVISEGIQTHAARPWGGKNAIAAMLDLLAALPLGSDPAAEAVRNLQKLFPYGDNEGRALGIAMEDAVSGQLSLAFSVLDLNECGFTALFDVRAPLCATEENTKQVAETRMQALGWNCMGGFEPGHAVEEDSPFVQTLIHTYEEFSGKEGYCQAIGGGTYVHNIPGGVAFGAKDPEFDARTHGANERASLAQLLLTAEIYAAVIARVCA